MIQIWRFFPQDGSGTIDFREYIIGLSLVSDPANTEDTLQMAFKVRKEGRKEWFI